MIRIGCRYVRPLPRLSADEIRVQDWVLSMREPQPESRWVLRPDSLAFVGIVLAVGCIGVLLLRFYQGA